MILSLGAFVCWCLTLTLWRSQQKLNLILEDLYTDDTHPAKIINERCKGWSMRRLIGYGIPTVCSSVLLLGAILATFTLIEPPK